MMNMGYNQVQAVQALQQANGNIETAINIIANTSYPGNFSAGGNGGVPQNIPPNVPAGQASGTQMGGAAGPQMSQEDIQM